MLARKVKEATAIPSTLISVFFMMYLRAWHILNLLLNFALQFTSGRRAIFWRESLAKDDLLLKASGLTCGPVPGI